MIYLNRMITAIILKSLLIVACFIAFTGNYLFAQETINVLYQKGTDDSLIYLMRSSSRYNLYPISQDLLDFDIDFVLIPSASEFDSNNSDVSAIKALLDRGVPVVVVGAGVEFRDKYDIKSFSDFSKNDNIILYGVKKLKNGKVSDYYLVNHTLVMFEGEMHEVSQANDFFRGNDKSVSSGHSIVATSPELNIFDAVYDWSKKEMPLSIEKGAGPWDAAYTTRWQTTSNSDKYVCTWDFDVFKLVDIRPAKDYYIIDARPHTEIVSYQASYSTRVGYYIHSRYASLDYDYYDSYNYRMSSLEEYGPTGTVSGTSVGWTIGASLTTEAGGINASYSQSFNSADVTVADYSSLSNASTKWLESYRGPSYGWWPTSISEPCDNAISSHFSELGAVVSVQSDGISAPNNMRAHVSVGDTIYYDDNWHWCNIVQVCWTYHYYTPGYNGSITVDYNRPPKITEYNPSNDIIYLTAGNCVNFNVTAEDDDGTTPEYSWYLDNSNKATGATWRYCPSFDDGGNHSVKVVASDGDDSDEQIWTVIVTVPSVEITINSSPMGRNVQVDGNSYITPQTFDWTLNSNHSIGVNSPQTVNNEVRYMYSYWSDGGTQNHQVFANSNKTIYCYFNTQYKLTTLADPVNGGTVNPSGANWYNEGSNVQVTAIPMNGFRFDKWQGHASGTMTPTTVHMNDSKYLTAIFGEISDVSVQDNVLPQEYKLMQNYPNPFNPTTTIKFSISRSCHVLVEVFNLSGELIAELQNGTLQAGYNEIIWNGKDSKGNQMPSGIYFYSLITDEYRESKKMILLK